MQDERSQPEGSPDDVSAPSSNEEEHATEGSSEMVPEKRAVHSDEDSGEDARTADTVTVDTESEEQLPPETTVRARGALCAVQSIMTCADE